MKLSLDIIPGKPKWRCSYVARVYTVVLDHSIDFEMPLFHRQTFPTSRSKLCWSLLEGNLVFSASISSSMLNRKRKRKKQRKREERERDTFKIVRFFHTYFTLFPITWTWKVTPRHQGDLLKISRSKFGRLDITRNEIDRRLTFDVMYSDDKC